MTCMRWPCRWRSFSMIWQVVTSVKISEKGCDFSFFICSFFHNVYSLFIHKENMTSEPIHFFQLYNAFYKQFEANTLQKKMYFSTSLYPGLLATSPHPSIFCMEFSKALLVIFIPKRFLSSSIQVLLDLSSPSFHLQSVSPFCHSPYVATLGSILDTQIWVKVWAGNFPPHAR